MGGLSRPVCCNSGGPKLTNLFLQMILCYLQRRPRIKPTSLRLACKAFVMPLWELISFPKSRVYFSSNVPDEHANEISRILGIVVTYDLGFYLGMPTINGRVTKATFQHIIDKVDKRLSG